MKSTDKKNQNPDNIPETQETEVQPTGINPATTIEEPETANQEAPQTTAGKTGDDGAIVSPKADEGDLPIEHLPENNITTVVEVSEQELPEPESMNLATDVIEDEASTEIPKDLTEPEPAMTAIEENDAPEETQEVMEDHQPYAEAVVEESIQMEAAEEVITMEVADESIDLKVTEPATPEDKEKAEAEEKDTQAQPVISEEAEKPQSEADISLDQNEEDEDESEEGDESAVEETEEKYIELSRAELIEALEQALEADDINLVKTKVALLKVTFLRKTKEEKDDYLDKFLKDGGNKEEYVAFTDELEERFNSAFARYKEKRAAWLESQESLKAENLKAKNLILEELRSLINSEETLKKTYDEFKELQERWKQIGQVPREEVNNLWQSYHFLVEKFFDKVKINRELKDLDLKKNLEAKIELCEKVEELLLEPSLIKSFRMLQKYHQEWKELGPVPQDKKDEIWDRFRSVTDKLNQRRKDHYDKIQDEQEKNLLAKSALCEKAEEILAREHNSIKQWQDSSNQFDELFKVWRTIGPAPKAQNDEIWNRFRSYMEAFFAAKRDHFNSVKEEQINNYNLKLDIVNQAEALKSSTDWKKTTQELINLQKQWKEIGPVPRKHSEKIWARFRAACDEFFKSKSDYFTNISAHEETNLQKKRDILDKLRNQEFTDNKTENLHIINALQREWMEVGHVPIKEKDVIQQEFRKLVDQKLDELKISSFEMDTMKYRSRFENIREGKDGNRILNKERNQLQTIISQKQDEINLWENNLGFLANSKKAQVLKEEFEQKILKAKQEIALLEARLKVLKESL